MASFVDHLPTFKEYVQQFPVEAAVRVGTYKQGKYDEGIQKIQQHIDNVAGIDVVRDVDKQYLNSKLNELKGGLRKVAAGDFSNYQLVNNVGGMISQVAKDPSVVNAASSTAWYRKQIEKMQKDVDEGKSNPANIDYFQKHAQTWLNSPNAGEKFSGQYIPNFDVFKFAKEAFDAVKPDGYSFDQLYITDQNGVPKTDAQGRPIASPIMKRLEKEGIFPEKVRATLNQIFSDPRVDTQLSISGEYALKQYSPQLLSNRILYQKNKVVGDLQDQLNALNLQKNTGKNVQADIDIIQQQIENTRVKYDDFSRLALSSPDAVRASLYKDDVKSNYTSMFGWTKTKEQSMESPLWNANFRLNQEANRVAEFRERMDFEKGKEAFDRQYKITDLNLKAQKELNKGQLPANAKQDAQLSDPNIGVMQFDALYEGAAKNYNDTSSDFIYSMVLKNPENDAELQKYIRAGNSKEASIEILMKNKVRQKYLAQGIEPDEEIINNEVADLKTKWEQEAIVAINKMTPVEKEKNSDVADSYNTYSRAKKEFLKATEIKNEAEKVMGTELANTLNSANFKASPIKVNIGGKAITLTPEDLYNAALYLKGNEAPIGFMNNESLRGQAKIAETALINAGKGEILDYIEDHANEFLDGPTNAAISNISIGASIENPNLVKQFKKLYKDIDNTTLQAAIRSKADAIKQLGFTVSPNLRVDIVTGNTEADRNTFTKILATAGNYTSVKQNLSPDFDYSKINDVLNSKDNIKPLELKTRKNDATGEITPELVFYGDNGKRVAGMVISPEEALAIGINTNSLYESADIKILRDRMNASPLGSTSIGDPKEILTYVEGDAWFEKQDFPNLTGSRYDVKANLVRKNGLVYPVIYVTDGITTPLPRTLPGQRDVADAVDKLMSVTPQFVNSILNEK